MNIKITPKGGEKEDITVSKEEFDVMSELVLKMLDVVDKSPNIYSLSDLMFIFSFFIAAAGQILNREFVLHGFLLPREGEGWVDLLSTHAKAWIKKYGTNINGNNLS